VFVFLMLCYGSSTAQFLHLAKFYTLLKLAKCITFSESNPLGVIRVI
jgi:hypothetical protein